MRDPWFERTLILLCQHNDEGALGLIINRVGDVDLLNNIINAVINIIDSIVLNATVVVRGCGYREAAPAGH